MESLSHLTVGKSYPVHESTVVRADYVLRISFRRPPTHQRRVRRIASKDVSQLILSARRGWQSQQYLAVVQFQVIRSGVTLQHVAHDRHVVAVNLPGAEVCHGAVIIRPGAFEAVGVNEIGGQTIRAGKGRNAEFYRRGCEVGVFRENRVERWRSPLNLERVEINAVRTRVRLR